MLKLDIRLSELRSRLCAAEGLSRNEFIPTFATDPVDREASKNPT